MTACKNCLSVTASIILLSYSWSCAEPTSGDSFSRSDALERIEQDVRSGEYGNIHAVVAIQNGELQAEWYFEGEDERRGRDLGVVAFDENTLHDLRSVTKSVVSLLFGIAIQQDAVASVDEPIAGFFQDYQEQLRAEHSEIGLRHLLSMTSGIRWDERTYPYTDSRNSETRMDLADDRTDLILSEPVEARPGQRFNYSGGDVELIAQIIERTTGRGLDDFASDELFMPLGISEFEWLDYRDGRPIAASGLRMSPMAMAKIGQLVLQRGRWQDIQIVPETWIEESTTFKAEISEDRDCGVQYGYFWWLRTVCDGQTRIRYVEGNGNGGQLIVVVPELDLVIVTAAGFYNGQVPVRDLMLAVLGILI